MINRFMIAAAAVVLTAPLAIAGPVDSACMRSDRNTSRQLCGCIQRAADMTLSRADQRRAAKFFTDADQAQKVRMSKSDADNAFWTRYKNFAATAEAYCTN